MIKNKKIAVFGLGLEGVATINYFGKSNSVFVYDEKSKGEIDKSIFNSIKAKNVVFYFGKPPRNVPEFDYLFRSAGVMPDNLKIKLLSTKNTKILSATKYFFENCKATIIGVTGTKGKGTTSTLIYELLKNSQKDVFIAGNIGTPMLQILPKINKNSFVVLELSSFQLIDLQRSPHISVVLMVTSEHLDWHKNQEEYLNAKKNIVKYQNKNDFVVINKDFQNSRTFAKVALAKQYYFSTNTQTNGVFIKGNNILSNINGSEKICEINKVNLPGRHNLQNICASICVAKILNVQNNVICNVIKNFKGLPHRLEIVANIKGVKYYNDSFSTTPETSIAAIESFKNPKILIIGGSSKKSDFSVLVKKIVSDKSIKKVILIGKEAQTINNLFPKNISDNLIINKQPKSMSEIVNIAKSCSSAGEIVLLSPACASFDMFKNYKDRGEQFKREVYKIEGN